MEACLVLEDGSVWKGRGFGAAGRVSGEVVFNTGMVGYTESLTDPSYRGQILCFTYPLIGNYGVSSSDFESPRPQIEGCVVGEPCQTPSHANSPETLDAWLKRNGRPGLWGIDTRSLTKRLRVKGVMLGILECSEKPANLARLRKMADHLADPNRRNLVAEVTTEKEVVYNPESSPCLVLLDCGVKESILRSLVKRGVKVVRMPAGSSFDTLLGHHPAGIVVSNGPGDPRRTKETIRTVGRVLSQGIPTFGICLGNQILALAAGGNTYKLKFGHRSQNQPCLEEGTGRCFITCQNHGYAVDAGTLPPGWKPWFTNANDRTNEGIVHSSGLFIGVQFHPEANPGPLDTEFLFDRFLEKLR